MRRIMVDHARARHALKRGAGAIRVTLDETALVTEERAEEPLALDEALEKLAEFDRRRCEIVEMRYFGGLTVEEIAYVLKGHPNTVKRDWRGGQSVALRRADHGRILMEPELWQRITDLFDEAMTRGPKSASRFSRKPARATETCANRSSGSSNLTKNRVTFSSLQPLPKLPNF